MSLLKQGRLHRFICGEFYNDTARPNLSPKQMSVEVLSGLTVSLALVPEAVAFAFVAGVAPLVGLYAAFIVGLVTALFGGRPGMISGATGALAVVMVALVMEHGVQYLFATVVLMGILQLIAGALRWGKFIRMVPYPVMIGFVNGLAIVIGLAQLEQFKIAGPDGNMRWMEGEILFNTIGMIVLTMLVIWQAPRLTRLVPAVPLTLETLGIIFPYALILAAIGLIESLLTLNLVGDMTEQRGGASRECVAQGAANFLTGFFGGMGGCAMIGQSMINVKSGGRTRIAGIAAALFLLGFILFAASLIEQIPIAALVGVMFMVVIGTFAWHSITTLRKVPRADALVILTVTAVTVIEDLAIAVIVGVIMSALVYAWNAAKTIQASKRPSISEKGAIVYDIKGPLFFGSATGFRELFQIKDDPATVIIDFATSRVVDQSALQAIEDIAAKYHEAGKTVMLRHLSPDCHKLLSRSGQLIIGSDDDPEYKVAVDYRVRQGAFESGI
jgi:SulP family sulfate permease